MDYPYWSLFLGVTAATTVRYVLVAGLAWLVVWVLWRRVFRRWRIQAKDIPRAQVRREVAYSLSTALIFALVALLIKWMYTQGWTQAYGRISAYGWPYFALSVVLLILLHDAYFYWTHRLMHHPLLFRHVHRVHHLSTSPTPWAAFAFHPFEAVIEAGILPLAIVLFPLHPYAILLFLLYMTLLNVLGHLGHELFPRGFTTGRWSWWHNTTTHHDLHHKTFRYNYGIYFNWWDRLMGTNHPRYHDVFDDVKTRGEEKKFRIDNL